MSARGSCIQFQERIGAWLEGEHVAGLGEHLRACGSCSALLEDFRAIRAAAPALAEADVPEHIWAAVRARLEAEGMIHQPRRGNWLEGFSLHVPRFSLATAYAGLLLAAGFLLGNQGIQLRHAVWQQSTLAADATVNHQLDTVERATLANFQDPNPEVTETLDHDLRMIDHYIVLCEKSAREMPQSELARDYLNDAYEQKAELLSAMNDRGIDTQ
jgi:hypothetical protein